MWFMICLIILFAVLCMAYGYIGYAKKRRIKKEEMSRIKEEEYKIYKEEREKKKEEAIKEYRESRKRARDEIRKTLEENRKSHHESNTHPTDVRGGNGNEIIVGWETVRNGDRVFKRAITEKNPNVPLSTKRTNTDTYIPPVSVDTYYDNNCNNDTYSNDSSSSSDGGSCGCD